MTKCDDNDIYKLLLDFFIIDYLSPKVWMTTACYPYVFYLWSILGTLRIALAKIMLNLLMDKNCYSCKVIIKVLLFWILVSLINIKKCSKWFVHCWGRNKVMLWFENILSVAD